MKIILNHKALQKAQQLIYKGAFIMDSRDLWRDHAPRLQIENLFLQQFGREEFANWYLGVEDNPHKSLRERLKFPLGDFESLHWCSIRVIESQSLHDKNLEIYQAVSHLKWIIERNQNICMAQSM